MRGHELLIAVWLPCTAAASICHGVETLVTADVVRDKKVTTIPKCHFNDEAAVSEASEDKEGFLVHEVDSPYQKGKTQVYVLTPDRMDNGRQYPVVYVLPVEPGDGTQHGDGLVEIKKLDVHNKFGVIAVMPTFSDWPWYCDHPTDPGIRQETYFVKVVVPLIERTYPVLPAPAGRLLLGFSKSGLGAFTLLLRHPDFFGRAAAWDAPLKMAEPNLVFGTQENFDNYRVSTLLENGAAKLKTHGRLAMIGYSRSAKYRPHHQAIHDQMTRLGIPHDYRDVLHEEHDWRSGWLEDAVKFLVVGQDESPAVAVD